MSDLVLPLLAPSDLDDARGRRSLRHGDWALMLVLRTGDPEHHHMKQELLPIEKSSCEDSLICADQPSDVLFI